MGKGKMNQKGDQAFSKFQASGGRFTPMKGDINQYGKENAATNMDGRFSKTKLSGGRFTPVGDTNFVNNLLKNDIKWTPSKIIIFGLIFIIPYGALLYILSSISPLITGLMIGGPLVIFAFFYFLHIMTKDL